MNNLLAQYQKDLGGPLEGIGPLGLEGNPKWYANQTFSNFISSAIGLMTVIASIYFVFLLIIGGIGIMNAGGDKAALEAARKKITNGIIGMVVVVASVFVIRFIGSLIGLNDVLNPSIFLDNLSL